MKPPIYRVAGFRHVKDYQLHIVFDDGLEQDVDFEPVLAGPIFGPLRDPAHVAQVRLDPEVRTLVWPNGADFDPATLHNWPLEVAERSERARRWAVPAA